MSTDKGVQRTFWNSKKAYAVVASGAVAGTEITVAGIKTQAAGQSATGFASNPRADEIAHVFHQHQGLTPDFSAEKLTGTTATTNMAVSGITTADNILAAYAIPTSTKQVTTGLKQVTAAGAAAATNITVTGAATSDVIVSVKTLPRVFAAAVAGGNTTSSVTGIKTTDRLLLVTAEDATSGKETDLTSGATIGSDGHISYTGDQTSNQVKVFWERPAADLTSEASFTSTNNLQLSTTVTTGLQLEVTYWDVSALYDVLNVTAECSITSNGNVQMASTNLTGYAVLLLWSSGGASTGIIADLRDEATVSSDGHITLSDTDTDGDSLVVVFVSELGEGAPLS